MIGTLQLVFFKQVWTKNFSDINLMMGGLCFLGLSQLLVVNLGEVRLLISIFTLTRYITIYSMSF